MKNEKKSHALPYGMLKQVAERAGVSTTTIYNVLNNRTNVSPETCLQVANSIKEAKQAEKKIKKSADRMALKTQKLLAQ